MRTLDRNKRRSSGFSLIEVMVTSGILMAVSAIVMSGYRSLEENQRVEFEITQGPKGPQAENIRPV